MAFLLCHCEAFGQKQSLAFEWVEIATVAFGSAVRCPVGFAMT